jgi:hypothetical protein
VPEKRSLKFHMITDFNREYERSTLTNLAAQPNLLSKTEKQLAAGPAGQLGRGTIRFEANPGIAPA